MTRVRGANPEPSVIVCAQSAGPDHRNKLQVPRFRGVVQYAGERDREWTSFATGNAGGAARCLPSAGAAIAAKPTAERRVGERAIGAVNVAPTGAISGAKKDAWITVIGSVPTGPVSGPA